MSKFLSERYQSLKPYAPGEQPQNMKFIKLNTNESPFPPSPKVIDAINGDELKNLRLYSDPESKKCTQAIADYYKVESNQVLVANGSDEILAFLYMAFCDEKNDIVFPEISYGFYPVYCELFCLKQNFIPLKSNLEVDVDAFCNINKNIIIANPNAPTGLAIAIDDITKILETNPNNIVIIDEAYVDFGAESAVSLVSNYDNLVVVQTFSKSRSLAGARLGFAISNKEIICDLNKIKYSFNPYNVNRLTDIAGKYAIEDTIYFEKCTKTIIKNREYTVEKLNQLGFEILPSKANFIFAKRKGLKGADYYAKLKDKGILVRHFNKPLISDFVRISIGTKSDMDSLIQKTKEILIKENLLWEQLKLNAKQKKQI